MDSIRQEIPNYPDEKLKEALTAFMEAQEKPKKNPLNGFLEGQKEILVTPKQQYLFKELPFFKVEPIFYAVATLIALAVIGLSAFGFLALEFLVIPTALFLVVVWGLWFLKRFLYLPRKNRHPILKIFKSGIGLISCEEPKENKVKVGKNLVNVTNMRAHTEGYTGHPLLIAFEDYWQNLNLGKMLEGKASKQNADDVQALLDEAKEQGARTERLKAQSNVRNTLTDPLFWVTAITLLVLIGSVFFVHMPMQDTMKEMKESIDSLNGTLTELKNQNNKPEVEVVQTGGVQS
jgi:hypothetical protein